MKDENLNPEEISSDFWVECDVCKLQFKNWIGSTPCCGSIAYIVEDGKATTKINLFASKGGEPIKPTVIDNYLKDLEEMSDRIADFSEYYYKLLDGVKDLEGNQKAIFVWVLMNKIRDIGCENGKRATNEAMIKFLNCR